MYLVDGALGKPKQKQEIDITQTIQFDAGQIEQVIKNHLPRIVEMCGPEIRGLLPSGAEQTQVARGNLRTTFGHVFQRYPAAQLGEIFVSVMSQLSSFRLDAESKTFWTH